MKHFLRKVLTLKIYPGVCVGGGGGGGFLVKLRLEVTLETFQNKFKRLLRQIPHIFRSLYSDFLLNNSQVQKAIT